VLPERTHVILEVFDILGKRVRTLVNTVEEAGPYSVTWDATDELGRALANGMYVYRMITPRFKDIKRMTFVK